MTKPVVAYIAGFTAPPEDDGARRGDHLGLRGDGRAKKDVLEAKGIRVGTTPTETAQFVAEVIAA